MRHTLALASAAWLTTSMAFAQDSEAIKARMLAEMDRCSSDFVDGTITTFADWSACQNIAKLKAFKAINYLFPDLVVREAFEELATARRIDAGLITPKEADAINAAARARMNADAYRRLSEMMEAQREQEVARSRLELLRRLQEVERLAASEREIIELHIVGDMLRPVPGRSSTTTMCQWQGPWLQCNTN